jgi:nickel-dependent lactate racemase
METQGDILSETEAGHSDGESLKLVPVAESIRYRKRAQSAEKKVEALAEQLAEAKEKACEMSEQLSNVRFERELIRKLAAAGTVDLETAVLVAKAKIKAQDEADVDGVIGQLKKEKQYLFGSQQGTVAAAKKTAGAKDRMTNKQTILERAAKKAATTGNRTDLQEYLKLRRNFI